MGISLGHCQKFFQTFIYRFLSAFFLKFLQCITQDPFRNSFIYSFRFLEFPPGSLLEILRDFFWDIFKHSIRGFSRDSFMDLFQDFLRIFPGFTNYCQNCTWDPLGFFRDFLQEFFKVFLPGFLHLLLFICFLQGFL